MILGAARRRLLADGHRGLSTRKVAEAAGVPLSQLHYYFGSKQGLLLALLEAENARRLERQTRMYAADRPLWERYEQACDFLEDDLDSGFVRVLQEMIAEGWANEQIAEAVRTLLSSWYELLTEVADEAEARFGPLGPVHRPRGGDPDRQHVPRVGGADPARVRSRPLPIRAALRRIGVLIRQPRKGRPMRAREPDAATSSSATA